MPLGGRVGAGEEQAHIGPLRVGAPHLLPVDDEPVVRGLGAGSQRREVAPRVGLAEQLAPYVRPGADAGEQVALLRLGAELEDRVACEHHLLERPVRTSSVQLLHDDEVAWSAGGPRFRPMRTAIPHRGSPPRTAPRTTLGWMLPRHGREEHEGLRGATAVVHAARRRPGPPHETRCRPDDVSRSRPGVATEHRGQVCTKRGFVERRGLGGDGVCQG